MGLITDFPEDQDDYDTFRVNEKEIKALMEVAEAARKADNQGYDVPHFVIEALDKLDEARRG